MYGEVGLAAWRADLTRRSTRWRKHDAQRGPKPLPRRASALDAQRT